MGSGYSTFKASIIDCTFSFTGTTSFEWILTYISAERKKYFLSVTKRNGFVYDDVVSIGGIPVEMTLDCIRPGKRVVVVEVNTDAALKRRLKDFGLVPGISVCCRYRCPWGNLTALELRGSVLALRTRDLKKIRVRC